MGTDKLKIRPELNIYPSTRMAGQTAMRRKAVVAGARGALPATTSRTRPPSRRRSGRNSSRAQAGPGRPAARAVARTDRALQTVLTATLHTAHCTLHTAQSTLHTAQFISNSLLVGEESCEAVAASQAGGLAVQPVEDAWHGRQDGGLQRRQVS